MYFRRLGHGIGQRAPASRLSPRRARRTHEGAPALARLQVRPRRVHQPQVRLDVVPEARVPVGLGDIVIEVLGGGRTGPAHVAHDDVEAAGGGDGVADQTLDVVAAAGVGADQVEAWSRWRRGGRCQGTGDLGELVEEAFTACSVIGVVDDLSESRYIRRLFFWLCGVFY